MDLLHFEVQRIDDTHSSVMRSINLILEEFKKNSRVSFKVTDNFLDCFRKTVFNWLFNHNLKEITAMCLEIEKLQEEMDPDFANPFSAQGSIKKKFAAQIYELKQILDTYRAMYPYYAARARILGIDKDAEFMRAILNAFKKSDSLILTQGDILNNILHAVADKGNYIERCKILINFLTEHLLYHPQLTTTHCSLIHS